MDLLKYDYPRNHKGRIDAKLLAEAKERGFYKGYTKYNSLFSSIFYNKHTPTLKPGATTDDHKKVWSYCKALMGSWNPKHEDKEAVCSMLMSVVLLTENEIQAQNSFFGKIKEFFKASQG